MRQPSSQLAVCRVLALLLLLDGCGSSGIPVGPARVAPRIMAITPADHVGAAARHAIFNATIEGTVTNYAWDFGGGARPNSSTTASPDVTLGIPGTYTGHLIAGNGPSTSASVPFVFTVDSPPSPKWLTHTWPFEGFGSVPLLLASAHRLYLGYGTNVRISLNETPQTDADWTTGRIPEGYAAIIFHEDRMMRGFSSWPGSGLSIETTDSEIPQAGDWTRLSVDPTAGTGVPGLGSINDRLFISYAASAPVPFLRIAQALVAHPAQGPDWLFTDFPDQPFAASGAWAIENGHPVLVFCSPTGLILSRPTRYAGAWLDWQTTVIDPSVQSDQIFCYNLADRLVVVCQAGHLPTNNLEETSNLLFVASADAPARPEDWRKIVLSDPASHPRLGVAVADERLVLNFVWRALEPNPTSLAAFQPSDRNDIRGGSIAVLGDRIFEAETVGDYDDLVIHQTGFW